MSNPPGPFPPHSSGAGSAARPGPTPPPGRPAPNPGLYAPGVHGSSAQTTQPIAVGSPVPPPAPAAPPPRTRGGLLVATLIVAVIGLVVGMAGVVISALALGRSDEAATLAADAKNAAAAPAATNPAAAPTTTPAVDETTDPATEPATDPEVSASPGDISPTAQFTVAYEGEHLRVRSPGCNVGNRTYVDLDKPPRVGVASEISELSYQDCNPGKIYTDLQFAQVAGPTATPSDCLETIRTDPGHSPVAPSRGMTLCFVTSQNSAASQGITQKLVFVTVDSITTDDSTGVLNVTVKAWDVPQ